MPSPYPTPPRRAVPHPTRPGCKRFKPHVDGVEEEVVAEAPDTRPKGRGKGAKIPLDPDALLDFEGFGKIKD